MSALRVLYFIDSLGSGGAQRQMVTLIRSLDRGVVEPEVAVYHPLFHFGPDLSEIDVRVHLLGRSGARDPRVLLRLIGLIRRGDFDLVHSYLRTPGILVRVAAGFAPSCRVVVSERSVDIGASPGKLFLERALARRAETMIANADVVRDEVERVVPAWSGRVSVVPNGVEWSPPTASEIGAAADLRGRHVASDDELLLAVVARVERPKDPHLLLDALEMLPDDVLSRIRVVWAGAWNDESLAASVFERLGSGRLADRVNMLNEVSDVRSVYMASDAVILPSAWEAFPNAVLEALAHGRPVISTDVGDVSEMVRPGESGWVVPRHDPVALAAAISELVSTPPTRRAQMGKAGSAFVLDEYSAERLAERTLAVYRRVLENTRPADGRQVD